MRAALRHAYPRWEYDPIADDDREVWKGKMRIVRSAKRMRELKRRGVPLLHIGYGDGTLAQQRVGPGIYGPGTRTAFGPWAWFVEEANPTRDVQQFLKRRTRAKFRRAERLREMFRAQLADPHVLGLVITPFIHALDARPRRHWQDEPLPISGWNEFGTERPSRIDYANIEARVMAHGYALEVEPATPEQRAQRVSPPVTLYLPEPYVSPEEDAAARLYFLPQPANAGVPTHYEACPSCGMPLRTNLLGHAYCATCENV